MAKRAKKSSNKKFQAFIFEDGSTFTSDVPLTKAQAEKESLQGEAGLKVVRAY